LKSTASRIYKEDKKKPTKRLKNIDSDAAAKAKKKKKRGRQNNKNPTTLQ
jgi:hypothetical protein